MTQQTFFESMSIAGLEKIHTQMINWIINNNEISSNIRISVLNALFDTQIKLDALPIYGMTEFTNKKSIDFLARVDSHLFILENKVNSSQHDNQLDEYSAIIKKNMEESKKNASQYSFFKSVHEIHYAFLTLIGELPTSETHSKWKSITYTQWKKAIDYHWSVMKKQLSPRNQAIMEDYRETLCKMVKFTKLFVNENECPNPKDYPHILFASKKQKHEKFFLLTDNNYYANETERYIAQQNMETMMQKAFFRKIAKDLHLPKEIMYDIQETHGSALLQITSKILTDKNGIEYAVGIQFQNETAKINYRHKNLNNYKKSQGPVPERIKKIFTTISKKEKEFKFKINNGTTKKYISISCPLSEKVAEMNYQETLNIFKKTYKKFSDIIDKYFARIEADSYWRKKNSQK